MKKKEEEEDKKKASKITDAAAVCIKFVLSLAGLVVRHDTIGWQLCQQFHH